MRPIMNTNKPKLILLFTLLVVACSTPTGNHQKSIDLESYMEEIQLWHQKRNEYQVSENGWVNLAGLFWLKEGINSFGSDVVNNLVFPEGKAPEKAGYMVVQNGTVTVKANPGIIFRYNNREAGSGLLYHPDSSRITMAYGSLLWFVIKRDDKLGIRLRDLESPLLTAFKGIEFYPINKAWRIEGKVEWADSSRTVEITNVLGQTLQQRSVASLVFEHEGRRYRLDAFDEDNDEFFVIFGDDTNARETYGAGRYLYVPLPDSSGKVILDFNKAYNPPCAFTEFATCPLPPRQNILPFAIPAGEKNYGNH